MGAQMTSMRRFQMVAALLAALLAGCEGDSPTAPPSGGSGGGGGGTSTVTTVVVTSSNPSPLIDSTSVITATVTQNGSPAPNGTAVEFTTDFGTFEESGTTAVLRTTTNGVATATLTAGAAGTATVRVRVNNVVRELTVDFRESTSTTTSITNINPSSGSAAGGDQVVITGRNFAGPVRVLFDGREATVISVTDTEIRVVTPPGDVPASAQFKEVDVTVITRAGTPEEERVTREAGFRYELEVLTPLVYHISPASGPNEGNTRITIFGEGFQAPTRVFFGTGGGPGPLVNQVELEVVQVTFNQIIAVTPPALGLGTELRDQQVTVRVLNVLTNRDTALPLAYRYGPAMAITAIDNNQGPFTGGDRITIYGWGFDDPVAVSVAGVGASVIRVSGTEIVVITNGVFIDDCDDVTGPIIVTNIEDGGQAQGPDYIYRVVAPQVLDINRSSADIGDTVQLTVQNASGDTLRVQVGNTVTTATRISTDGNISTFAFQVPPIPTEEFDTAPCGLNDSGEQAVDTVFEVTVSDPGSGCEAGGTADPDTALEVDPGVNPCVGEEEPEPASGNVDPDAVAFGCNVTNSGTTTVNVNVTNTGSTSFSVAPFIEDEVGTCASGFSVDSGTRSVSPGGTQTFAVTFAPTADGTCTANLRFSSTSVQLPEVQLSGSAAATCGP